MFEKIPTGEQKKSNKKETFKKTVAGITAAGLTVGAAESAIAAKDSISESQDKKPIEQKVETDYSQTEKQRLESKFGAKIVTPEKREEDKKVERNYGEDFDIGAKIEHTGKGDYYAEMDVLGEFNDSVLILSGDKYSHLDNDGCNYKHKAFAQMVAKYGKTRFQEFLNFLQSIYSSEEKKSAEKILYAYGRNLPMVQGKDEQKVKLNNKLYNIADSLEQGKLEKLAELFDKLRQEGYDRNYEFAWSQQVIDKLLSDEEERKALIKLDKEYQIGTPNGTKYLKARDSIGGNVFDFMSPKEKLEAIESME